MRSRCCLLPRRQGKSERARRRHCHVKGWPQGRCLTDCFGLLDFARRSQLQVLLHRQRPLHPRHPQLNYHKTAGLIV